MQIAVEETKGGEKESRYAVIIPHWELDDGLPDHNQSPNHPEPGHALILSCSRGSSDKLHAGVLIHFGVKISLGLTYLLG